VFRRILLTAALAGLIAGLAVSLAQRVQVIPLIQLAETYEDEAQAQSHAAAHGPAGTYGQAEAREWEPAPGLERGLYTVMANVVTGVGFALVLVAGFALSGGRLDWRRGLAWGLAGFVSFALAPSLGLPPVPPGAGESDLVLRQLWWTGTVASTAVGLAVVVFAPKLPQRLAGIVFLALPHVVGAPRPTSAPVIPPELAVQFAVASLMTALVFWLVLGGLAAHLFGRLKEPRAV
jgi:cobalt transporter subunit CbtA